MTTPEEEPFSTSLQEWLEKPGSKKFTALGDVFSEKSFALAFMLLLSIAALPIPTGGVTHVFEIIAMLLALELIALRKNIWLPKRWQEKEIGKRTLTKVIPRLITIIRKVEKISKPRMSGFLASRVSRIYFGVSVLILSVGAFIAPPFSGLDTLPALGVVLISLGFILEDIIVVIFGTVVGVGGVFLTIGLGTAVFTFIGDLFS